MGVGSNFNLHFTKGVTMIRKEVYKFLSLPHYTKIKILRSLELIEDGDDIHSGIQFIATAFRRAKERNQISALSDIIEQQ